MKHTSKNKLFTTVAHSIKGRWQNFATDEILVFAPTEAPLDVSDLLIIKDGSVRTDYYLMGMKSNQEIYIVFGDETGISDATVKLITDDTMILQLANCNMLIFERKPDTSFADELIAGL